MIRELKNQVIIIALPDYNPLNQLMILGESLKKINYIGLVIFDLLVINGVSSNRFVSFIFNGYKFERKTLKIIKDIDYNIKRNQDDFFRKHFDLLESSVLSSEEIKTFNQA